MSNTTFLQLVTKKVHLQEGNLVEISQLQNLISVRAPNEYTRIACVLIKMFCEFRYISMQPAEILYIYAGISVVDG